MRACGESEWCGGGAEKKCTLPESDSSGPGGRSDEGANKEGNVAEGERRHLGDPNTWPECRPHCRRIGHHALAISIDSIVKFLKFHYYIK
jgi:hypothetical protein